MKKALFLAVAGMVVMLSCGPHGRGVPAISGPDRWIVNSPVRFSAQVNYTVAEWIEGQFTWGGFGTGPWIALTSETAFSDTHTYSSSGPYPVKAHVRTASGQISEWSDSMLIAVESGPTLRTTVAVGTGPRALLYHSLGDKVYCANGTGSSITVIDGTSDAVTGTITGVSHPVAFAWDETDDRIYSALSDANQVLVIDGTNDEVITTIYVGGNPQALAWDRTDDLVYCANTRNGTVSVIDGATAGVTATVPVADWPVALAWNRNLNHVYCASGMDSVVTVLGGTSNIGTLRVPGPVSALLYDSLSERLFVACGGRNLVAIFSGSTEALLDTVFTGVLPLGFVKNATSGAVYCFHQASGTLAAIDPSTGQVLATVSVGGGPHDAVWSARQDLIYCANAGSNDVAVVDGATNELIGLLPAGDQPWAVCLNPTDDKVYVASRTSANVTVINDR